MRTRHLLLLALVAAPAASAAPLPSHPRLLFSADGIAKLKKRVREAEWSAEWKRLQRNLDTTLGEKIDLPPRGANWWHWYVCPRHGARLTTGKSIGPWQWEHICPVDHEVLRGDATRPDRDFDGVVLNLQHDRYARDVRQAGILFQVTGDERYARRAREILLAYADRYATYTLHTTQGQARIGGGRITPQTLDESVWLIPLAQGADLVWDALPEGDRRTIADKLFLPAAREVILPHRMGVHNIQCWKNSAVGLVGFLLDDAELVRAAIDDPEQGYRVQMAKGVQGDGAWYEGAWGYHFYTLGALWPLVEAARNCGTDLYGEPLRKMFQAPVRLAMPNLVLPAFNDSAETPARNHLYELAYARYGDPLYLAALAGGDRRNEYALWFGVDSLPARQVSPQGSRNSTESGYAILEQGAGEDATWLCLKYGPHGGGHGHPDKNNFILYTRGRVLFPDPGTRPYGSPLHAEWDRVTLAHNTLVVDGKSQAQATGRCLSFGSENGMNYVTTDAGAIYEGVRFLRTALMLNPRLVVFVDRVTAGQPHTFDLVTHHEGRWLGVPEGEAAALPAAEGYQHLKDATVRRTAEPVSLQLAVEGGWRAAISLAGGAITEVITATGVGRSTEERVPVAIFRRTGERAVWVWAASLDGTPVRLQARPETAGPVAVTVEAGGRWAIEVDGAAGSVHVTRP